jgi:putative transposase
MPQSLSAVYVHLVFSTKLREAFLRDRAVREQLHTQLGAISKALGCAPLLIGGVEDHAHLLCRLARTITQADWVKELKRVSNNWAKRQGADYRNFEWQSGYAVFSVSKSNLAEVQQYIASQERHHRRVSFQEEIRALLRRHGLEFDEQYLWD